jgi:hypothetical protein
MAGGAEAHGKEARGIGHLDFGAIDAAFLDAVAAARDVPSRAHRKGADAAAIRLAGITFLATGVLGGLSPFSVTHSRRRKSDTSRRKACGCSTGGA